MLSAHYLDFSSYTTAWQCRGKLSSFENVAADLDSGGDSWSDIVWEYTSRSLTKSSDKLPALAGIIATLQQVIGDTCHAALWERHFVKLLLWNVKINEASGARAERPTKWRAPSCSFASIDGCVEYDYWTSEFCRTAKVIFAKLEECNVVPLDINNPLGELRSVSMILEHVSIQNPYTNLLRATHVSRAQ
jgi:hypothetical protein